VLSTSFKSISSVELFHTDLKVHTFHGAECLAHFCVFLLHEQAREQVGKSGQERTGQDRKGRKMIVEERERRGKERKRKDCTHA